MSDAIDQAQDFETLRREIAIGAVLQNGFAQGTDHCVTCGCEIEPARKAAMPNATRCIECQSKFEKSKRFRR